MGDDTSVRLGIFNAVISTPPTLGHPSVSEKFSLMSFVGRFPNRMEKLNAKVSSYRELVEETFFF